MPNLGANFYPKLVQISFELGMKPEDLIAVMISESGMNPGAVEKKFKGSGLVGFMPQTLKNLGFQGTWEDFIKLSGEEQLDYLKKMVKSFQGFNGGRPFTSAAQYYVANFWPVALKLPGIQRGDPDTAFIENNPQADPSGKWSQKYLNVGYKISVKMESDAYKANPLFDRDKKGSITYGDMLKQVEINKKNPMYQKALVAMRDSTNYTPGKEVPGMQPQQKDDWVEKYLAQNQDLQGSPANTNLDSVLDSFLKQVAASERQNKKIYKQLLPANDIVISIQAEYNNAVEFSRVLCTALDEELMADAFTHTDGNVVEVQCTIHGPSDTCLEATKQLVQSVQAAFKKATIKIGGIDVSTQFSMNKKSSYQQINLKNALNQHRKFLLQFI